jgi:hypothetical protein
VLTSRGPFNKSLQVSDCSAFKFKLTTQLEG